MALPLAKEVTDQCSWIVLDAMQSACISQPEASLGQTITLQRELFNTATVASSTKSTAVTTTTMSSSRTLSTTRATAASAAVTSAASGNSGLNTGAAVGVGIGGGIGGVLVVGVVVWVVLTRWKRTRGSRTDMLAPYPSCKVEPDSQTLIQELPLHQRYEIDDQGGNRTELTNELDGRPVLAS